MPSSFTSVAYPTSVSQGRRRNRHRYVRRHVPDKRYFAWRHGARVMGPATSVAKPIDVKVDAKANVGASTADILPRIEWGDGRWVRTKPAYRDEEIPSDRIFDLDPRAAVRGFGSRERRVGQNSHAVDDLETVGRRRSVRQAKQEERESTHFARLCTQHTHTRFQTLLIFWLTGR